MVISFFNQKLFYDLDLIQKAIDLYETSDLLAKLNAIEIISKLGLSKRTAEIIKSNKIFDLILKDATVSVNILNKNRFSLYSRKMIKNSILKNTQSFF